jgi:hypothetical protein
MRIFGRVLEPVGAAATIDDLNVAAQPPASLGMSSTEAELDDSRPAGIDEVRLHQARIEAAPGTPPRMAYTQPRWRLRDQGRQRMPDNGDLGMLGMALSR